MKIIILVLSIIAATPVAAQSPWEDWDWQQNESPQEPEEPVEAPQIPPATHTPEIPKKPPVGSVGPSSAYPWKGERQSIHILDRTVNFHETSVATILTPMDEPPGTIVINTRTRRLYLMQDGGLTRVYKIAVGKVGFSWKGTTEIRLKAKWPAWNPPKAMLKRRPELEEHVEGGPKNPLGARAMYLFDGTRDTLFRIHGTNEPQSISSATSSGCFRMYNADAIDLYNRVSVGTRVVVH